MQRYVSIIVFSPDLDEVCLLHKLKGPAHIVGKICIPGGRVEEMDYSLAEAAARELKEETGVFVHAENCIQVYRRADEHSELTTFLVIADLKGAQTQPGETEPVFIEKFDRVRSAAAAGDPSYMPDMQTLLQSIQDTPDAVDCMVRSYMKTNDTSAEEAAAYVHCLQVSPASRRRLTP